jgi:hypothetical protein
MKAGKNSADWLDRILRQAHRCREAPPVDSGWSETVMRQIRGFPVKAPGERSRWSFDFLVWRLAPATGLLVLIALAVLINSPLVADADLFQLFYADTQMLSLADF